MLATQRARAYTQAAQAAVRKIPNIRDVANRFGVFTSQRTPLSIARQILATSNVPDDLRRVAEQYLAERGPGMAPFAQILCRRAGVPHCAVWLLCRAKPRVRGRCRARGRIAHAPLGRA